MGVFGRLAEERFVTTVTQNLRRHYPERLARVDDHNLSRFIESTIVRLRTIGIDRECDVERYLYLMCEFGSDIDTSPRFRWVQDLLFDQSLSGELRMDMLYQYAQRRLDQGP